jgi:hypothetical protein
MENNSQEEIHPVKALVFGIVSLALALEALESALSLVPSSGTLEAFQKLLANLDLGTGNLQLVTLSFFISLILSGVAYGVVAIILGCRARHYALPCGADKKAKVGNALGIAGLAVGAVAITLVVLLAILEYPAFNAA